MATYQIIESYRVPSWRMDEYARGYIRIREPLGVIKTLYETYKSDKENRSISIVDIKELGIVRDTYPDKLLYVQSYREGTTSGAYYVDLKKVQPPSAFRHKSLRNTKQKSKRRSKVRSKGRSKQRRST